MPDVGVDLKLETSGKSVLVSLGRVDIIVEVVRCKTVPASKTLMASHQDAPKSPEFILPMPSRRLQG